MANALQKKAKELNRKRKNRSLWKKVFGPIALIAVFCTTYILILPAITLEGEPTCGFDEHLHSGECYEQVLIEELICGFEENEEILHEHSETCFGSEEILVCTEQEVSVHIHSESCFVSETKEILGENGIMAYIEIPCIDVMLPVYHGTEEPVLQVAVGHLEWTSLPTGGESTHCVLSGHRGLPSAKLFSDLDKVKVGDYFRLNVLDEVLTYEVDRIRIVFPEETDELLIEEGKDYCTLVTCTPYGVNSHRLLVRGHRIDNIEESQVVRVTSDAMIIEKLIVVPFVLVPILAVMFAWLLFGGKKHG